MGHPWRGSIPCYPRVQQPCEVGQRALGIAVPLWQQEPGKGPAEPPSARTTLVVGVMSVLFSAALAVLSLFCPARQWAQVPLLLASGSQQHPDTQVWHWQS